MSERYEKQNMGAPVDVVQGFVSAISNFYVSGYYLDLKNERYVAVGQSEVYNERYHVEDDWARMDDYIRECIHPDDQAMLTEVSRIDYIRNRLQQEESYSVEVREHGTGEERWYRFTIMRGSDEDHVAVVFVDVTDQIEQSGELMALNRELQNRQNGLEEAAAEQEAQLEEITALNEELQELNEKELIRQKEVEEGARILEEQIAKVIELNLSLKEYNDAMANAGYGMWHIVLKDGVEPRMQVNEKMAELLGIAGQNLSEEELYNAWYNQILPKAIPSVQASVSEMIEGHFSENTYQWIHPTKGKIWVRCGGTAVTLEDGTHILSGYHADVTDIVLEEKKHTVELEEARNKAEEEQKRVSEAYGMIKGLSQEYHTIWVVSKETSEMKLIRSSGVSTIRNAVQMGKDYPKFDEGFYKYINTYVEPEDRERMFREIAFDEILRQLEKGDNYAVNYLRRDESGHVGYHQIAFANADTESGVRQFVYGFRDIDHIVKAEMAQKQELKEAKQAAEEANAAKTAFLFNMSHDIRTPMNAIMGFRDLLEKHQEDPEKREDYLRKMEEASTVLLSIINNVLEMARIEKGSLELDETAWSAEQFNDTLYSVFSEMMKQKNIAFTRKIEVQNAYVYCDPTKLREIFINILSNAYKYTKEGGSVSMNLEEIPSDREGYALYRTTITDTGIGMDEEFLPHIFEEFAREKNTTEIKIEGTGLGMPIVKRLIDLMDGTIEVSSVKGVGSTFIVTIPHRIADRAKIVDHSGIQVDPELFAGKRILLAEDNDFNAEIAIEILEEAGFVVERAEDGQIACNLLEQAENGYFDLILMDIQMPNMNGYEAARQIRSMVDAEKANLPIIAMTANAFEEDKREAYRAGMNGHIAKPVRINSLMKALAGVL